MHVALLDLRDFIREYRTTPWHERVGEDTGEKRYKLAHAVFHRFVAEDEALSRSLIDAHRQIGNAMLGQYNERWETIDPEQATDLYALMYLPAHLRLGGLGVAHEALETSESYRKDQRRVASQAHDATAFVSR